MKNGLLGNQISKYRRERNMTQEELGRAVGVSTQAVSRWECGGAPDVTLLPRIADTLHVSVDALFGRDGTEAVDLLECVRYWAASLPREELLNSMVELVWAGVSGYLLRECGVSDLSPLEHAEVEYNGDRALSKSDLTADTGLLVGSYAKDLRFMLVFPEPDDGYAAFWAENEQYRGLFEVLSRPYALEIMLEFAGEKERFIVAASMAKRVGIPVEETEKLLEALAEQKLLKRMELELESGVTGAYSAEKTPMFIVFLYFARYLCQSGDVTHVCGAIRERPWLRKTGGAEKPEKPEKSKKPDAG